MNNNIKTNMNKKKLGLAVLIIVVLILVIVLSLNATKTNPTTKKNTQNSATNQAQNSQTPPIPTATSNIPVGPSIISSSSEVVASLSSLPGSEAAPKQEVVAADKIPSASIKLSVSESGFSPKSFTIKAGQKTSIAITNNSTSTHVFIFPNASLMGLQTMVSPGETKVTTFTAPNVGTYPFRDDIPSFRQNTGNMIVN